MKSHAYKVHKSFILEDVRYVFETNFFGAIRTTEAFLPFLEQSKLAVIENITSDLA